MKGNLGFLLSCDGELRFQLQGIQASSIMEARKSGLFSSSSRKLVFLSSCHGDLGVPLELQQSSQASYRVEVGNSGFLSSCDGYLGEPLQLHKGSLASFQVARWNKGLLTSHCRGIGPHVTLRGESRGFSRVVGSSEFLWSWDGDPREPLVLPQGSQTSFRVARDTSGFLSSRCRGIGPHLELRMETRGSSLVATGISGNLWSCIKVKPPFKL